MAVTGPYIDPSQWGSSVWSTLHWIAAGYPTHPTQADQAAYKTLFQTVQQTLPCLECREHFQALLAEMPVDPFLISGKQLRQWVTSLHNAVNARLSDQPQAWSLEQVDRKYPPVARRDESATESLAVPQPSEPKGSGYSTVRVPAPPARTEMSRFDIERLQKRQRQLIMQNNARSMGRVMRPAVSIRRVVPRNQRSAVVNLAPRAVTLAPNSTLVPPKPKKKGCGCNKKK